MKTNEEKKEKREVYEIAILGRATWNLHSLSNEGTVGNVTEPRTIALADGTQTDGVSGEMLKHMHAENMWALESDKEKFCEICQKFRPEKADGNKNVRKKSKAEEAVEEAIKCELCDIHGFLVQEPPATRESTVEFGWAAGLPGVQKDTHVHARHALHEARLAVKEQKDPGKWGKDKCCWEREEEEKVEKCTTDPNESMLYKVRGKWYCEEHFPGAITPQMLYHRPTRSGIYGIISVFQPWRIGLNNVSFSYDIKDGKERQSRYELVLKAYQSMFSRPEGAMTATRLPHMEGFEGMIVVSKKNSPTPVVSPLKDDYKEQVTEIKESMPEGDSVEMLEFTTVPEFVEKMKNLIDDTAPYKVEFGE